MLPLVVKLTSLNCVLAVVIAPDGNRIGINDDAMVCE